MTRARAGRTTLIVAHRLSTISTVNRVVLLDQGQVAATGTHDQLLERSDAYRRLVNAQLI